MGSRISRKWITRFSWKTTSEPIIKSSEAAALRIIECGGEFIRSKLIVRSITEAVRFIIEWIISRFLLN